MPPKPSRSKATKFPRPIHTERAAGLLVARRDSTPCFSHDHVSANSLH
jgi:hypothetical protein